MRKKSKSEKLFKKSDMPLISIVIATYNSGKTITKVLEAIKKQDYPKSKIELFIIDGGSSDDTISVAKKYKAIILNNPKMDQVYAKHMGYNKAHGVYMLLLDSDEVMEDKRSIRLKAMSMMMNKQVKTVISSGLKKPNSYPEINHYLNEFGDPFSFFMYRNSKDPKFFMEELKGKYEKVYEDRDRVTFNFSTTEDPPFIELTAMGVMVDLKYIKANLPKVIKNVPAHTHLYYMLISKKNLFSVMKHDPIIHYSVPTLSGYLRKIKSRIKSNIFGTSMGIAGFKGRERYHSKWYRFKKFLFLIYSISIILPLVDSIYMYISRKNSVYFIHTLLCLYTLILIIFYYLVKVLGLKTKLHGYGS